MSLWIQIPLFPIALVVWSIFTEMDIWFVYGYATFRESRFQRLSFRITLGLAVLLILSTIVVPIILLFTLGLWAANAALVGWSLAVSVSLYTIGRLMEWQPGWFYDTRRSRRALREIPAARRAQFEKVIEGWPGLAGEEREKFLQTYLGLPLHMRESFFTMLIDSVPVCSPAVSLPDSVGRHNAIGLRHWAGAHLFNCVDVLLEMRHRLDDEGVFRGEFLKSPPARDFPEGQGAMVFAREQEDVFALGRRRG